MSTTNSTSGSGSATALGTALGKIKWTPTLKVQRMVALVLLICQGGITVTGSIVRVTGSGLGCNTWPNCHPGSLIPVAGSAPALHQAIEFGNRMLTFVLIASVAAVLLALYGAQRRRELKVLGWLSLAGVVLQAIIGGISVLLDLKWWAVAVHFLPSMVLVWIAAILFSRIKEPDNGTPTHTFPQIVRTMAAVAAVSLAVVLVTGTMVTGSGPHAGDEGVGMEGRLDMDTEMLAIAHAVCMYVYLVFTVIVVWQIYAKKASPAAKRAAWVLIVAILIQWAIGVFQFYMGVPRWTVPFHIAMSSVVTAFTALLYAHGLTRLGGDENSLTGSVEGDAKRRRNGSSHVAN